MCYNIFGWWKMVRNEKIKIRKKNIFVVSKRRKEMKERDKVKKISNLSEIDFLLEYSEAEAKYNFNRNILKYFLPTVLLALLSASTVLIYKVLKMYLFDVDKWNNNLEMTNVAIVFFVICYVMFIMLIFIIIYAALKNIKFREREYLIYKNMSKKG